MNFRLTAPSLDFWVDIRLRGYGERWMAVADIAGEPEVGLGATPQAALAGSLAPLGDEAAAAFLADPQVLRVSRALRRLT